MRAGIASLMVLLFVPLVCLAQQPPAIGYVFPPGGQAGTSIEVRLGGYDWTPDMQVFVLDPRVKLELLGPPGPHRVSPPPYWFGKKARGRAFPMPRETPARWTIPSDVPAGIVRWQAVNANGITGVGSFFVGSGREVLEESSRDTPQFLGELPVTVSGQVLKIEEVDRYQFSVPKAGPVTCELFARRLGSPLNGVLEIRDAEKRLIADVADTEGLDLALTFAAQAGVVYTASLYDCDFRGHDAYVYRLAITPSPRVIAAIPAAGRRGETRAVQLIGYGIATGAAQIESVSKSVAFPTDPKATTFDVALETAFGSAAPRRLLVSDLPELIEADIASSGHRLPIPAAVTGVLLERDGADRFVCVGQKGSLWSIVAQSQEIGSTLDLSLAVLGADGKQLAVTDETSGTTDPRLEFTVPADGEYQLVVTDSSGKNGHAAAAYRLVVELATPGFSLSVPPSLTVLSGGKADLVVQATRRGGFQEPIALEVTGLPTGVSAAKELLIPAAAKELKVSLQSDAAGPVLAAFATVTGRSQSDANSQMQSAGPVLVATTMKPPFVIDGVGKDDVTKWPRGSTFPAPVTIERKDGFTGEINLEMHSQQDRHCQGIRGPELLVPPGVDRVDYPVFLPEWLETTRTSRMVVNGVARVPDPKGTPRYLVSKIVTRLGFLPGGALLKIGHRAGELRVPLGHSFEIPLTISRASQFVEPIRLELVASTDEANSFTATPLDLPAGQSDVKLQIVPVPDRGKLGDRTLTIRGTALQHGRYPVVSETAFTVEFVEAVQTK